MSTIDVAATWGTGVSATWGTDVVATWGETEAPVGAGHWPTVSVSITTPLVTVSVSVPVVTSEDIAPPIITISG